MGGNFELSLNGGEGLLRLDNIKLTPDEGEYRLKAKAAKLLRIPESDIQALHILRRAVDSRKELHLIYNVAVAVKNEKRCRTGVPYAPVDHALPPPSPVPVLPPVVVGLGPAGLFAALVLDRCGQKPIVLERGQCVERRKQDVDLFWQTGCLDTESNVQFGEGGAGAFSDGKLNTGTKDPRHRFILKTFVAHGAPETILYDGKPHIGTDKLYITLQGMRKELIALGADIRFGHKVVGLQKEGDTLTALTVEHEGKTYTLPCRDCVLAPGHSARDTVEKLYEQGLHMEPKPFAMGVRIEHSQRDMDVQQYRQWAGHPALGASTYKLSCHLLNGRSAFSFCVCPGGTVVAAASEEHMAVTNGMSEYARDKENINGALLVNVTPEDFPSVHPLAGFALQRQLERAAYDLGGGGYIAPCQRVEDFLVGRPSTACGKVAPSYRPGVRYTDLRECLPDFIAETIALALPELDKKLPGYAAPDALLTAAESRSSSPVKIPRDATYQGNIRGLYPCGEGAGYAGGILSAAADGMRCAEHILQKNEGDKRE